MTTELPANVKVNGTKPNWAPLLGLWEMGDQQLDRGGAINGSAFGQAFPTGLAISEATMENGVCHVRIRFAAPFTDRDQRGGIVLGFRSPDRRYVFAELGGSQSAYSIGEFINGTWRSIATTGQRQNLKNGRDYLLQVKITGQELSLQVDGVPVVECLLSHPVDGHQVGLIAAGEGEVVFSDFKVTSSRPKAFVAMQFAEPYDTFYRQVIQKQAEAAGFDVFRIDEKAGPGVIFQDIQREIEQSSVVIAEITPANPNVFYEIGYAHALAKPTILLAQRDSTLPFDIRSFRVVFYNDTIGGKSEVERHLQSHLEAVAGR